MVKLSAQGVWLLNGTTIIEDNIHSQEKIKQSLGYVPTKEDGVQKTIAYSILKAHNTSGNMENLKIRFDAMASHDITYVGIIQTARASGMERFPLPYVLTNCHNSLCAVGGTINEDDHLFGLSAAKKYGGIYVPPHLAVIHQYMREQMSGCGKMILGSDSHTRYGALGTLAVGEGGGELAKQLLGNTYDIARPQVVAVYLTGTPAKGVGPQDIALAIIREVFQNGYVKNKIMEFVGDGIANLNCEFRNGIDVMTTETACLSSIWATDSKTEEYFAAHGRSEAYRELRPGDAVYYDGMVYVDMSTIEPMIALPFHPSNAFSIRELYENLNDILSEVEKNAAKQLNTPGVSLSLRDKVVNGKLQVEQGVIAGCAGGTYDNLVDAADILRGKSIGCDAFSLSIYPSSQPVYMELVKNGAVADFMASGATVRTAFCGPCFGAGDVPANNCLSIRHSTRNFPNREGSKPGNGQIASVALMDARSIAATAINHGLLTPATDLDLSFTKPKYFFEKTIYENRVYNGFGKADSGEVLRLGPNIADWPKMSALTDDLLLTVASEIHDPVTTTDELIPSGETSSYRSNPLKLAEFTLSRKDPKYTERAKKSQQAEISRLEGKSPENIPELKGLFDQIRLIAGYENINPLKTGIGSLVYAVKPGDGSAREQAASCQKVLGGWANIAQEYATKRYRSNLINWGMLPLIYEESELPFQLGDSIFLPGIRKAVLEKAEKIQAYALRQDGTAVPFQMKLSNLTDDERKIILAGCLINFNREMQNR